MTRRIKPALLLLPFLVFAAATASADEPAADDAAFLDDLQRRTFDFFWETTPKENGLTPDRWPSSPESSIAAVGFALTAYPIGVEHGWVKRDAAAERTLATLRFFRDSAQNDQASNTAGYRGFYYHFLDPATGHRWRNCELSSIDTALLMLGVLFAREYYDGDTPAERDLRELADALYRRVEWGWMQPRAPLVAMSWRPEQRDRSERQTESDGFGRADYRGYNEAMFLYVLGLGSPTHPIDPGAWDAFCDEYDWAPFHGHDQVNFEPLFGHQYAACWFDLRGIQDAYMREKGIDYFENSRRATLAQREYAIANPNGWRGYGAEQWGLTACDGPGVSRGEVDGKQRRFRGYWARGASAVEVLDDGTITPTAAGGSIPFAPEATIPTLQAMKRRYGDLLYGRYGFLDSFNASYRAEFVPPGRPLRHSRVDPEHGWFNTDYLGIDQGPILLMAENHRTSFVWRVMKRSPYVREGLKRAGFAGGWLEEEGVRGQ